MYEQIVRENISKFKGDEKVMWESVRSVSRLLDKMKLHHPDLYWDFMREQHEIMFGKHFDEKYAKYEVEQMHHKTKDGKTHRGEHWPMEQTSEVMQSYKAKLPTEVTPGDFYVALNTQWHDYICWAMEHYESEDEADNAIIERAVRFWFCDDDWGDNCKVWEYFRTKNK